MYIYIYIFFFFFCIPGSAADAAAVNPNGIKSPFS